MLFSIIHVHSPVGLLCFYALEETTDEKNPKGSVKFRAARRGVKLMR